MQTNAERNIGGPVGQHRAFNKISQQGACALAGGIARQIEMSEVVDARKTAREWISL